MGDLICPNCECEFEAELDWKMGYCPDCGFKYNWDEIYIEETRDCWIVPIWEDDPYAECYFWGIQ